MFETLNDPFYAVDSRAYQCIKPNIELIESLGMTITALEKIRPERNRERAIMSMRFSEEIFGTQFHPEADPHGFLENLKENKKKETMINEYGMAKYQNIVDHIHDEDKIPKTQSIIIPTFLRHALDNTQQTPDTNKNPINKNSL